MRNDMCILYGKTIFDPQKKEKKRTLIVHNRVLSALNIHLKIVGTSLKYIKFSSFKYCNKWSLDTLPKKLTI
jgi:hypothetical protein